MKKNISIALLSLLLIVVASACNEDEKTISTTKASAGTTNVNQPEVQYGLPIMVKNTDILMYPLSLNSKDQDSDKREVKSIHWNFIFYNVISGTKDFLTREKLIINSFQIGDSEKGTSNQPTLSDQFIYYDINDADTDGDKKLTSKDANKLYFSTLGGKSFIRITPNNYTLSGWTLDNKHDLILLNLIKNVSGDKKSNHLPEVEYFTYNLKTGILKAVFDQKLKHEIENLAKKVL
ncbi:hypothetical protein EV200_104527 [Pedobacter psychrotolerans]|uniref:Lipoprotein n=1 Tax=Pedobacter psychrotolerans TaxID=1843235 RepID=A0A4R2HCK8_9SPHI|nr:hypothetical protein [Pedobacter psychrotolerans]TCO25489.1 hypothetical protein EV200_104527 [Pedobacter psychrotolerans]GGE45060.1 hypothetical protein GCM10011413_08980 [Pedobacter psychrotolerans]